jgi:hypothetical protein
MGSFTDLALRVSVLFSREPAKPMLVLRGKR